MSPFEPTIFKPVNLVFLFFGGLGCSVRSFELFPSHASTNVLGGPAAYPFDALEAICCFLAPNERDVVVPAIAKVVLILNLHAGVELLIEHLV